MTTRDRLMLIGIVTLAVLLGVWFTTVAPEREKASKVTAEVEAARQQVATAESQADSASSSRAQYSTAYASLVSLGQAVPASAETPALIYMLDRATHRRDVQFSSITTGSSGSSSASAAPAAQIAGFAQEPFTFVFSGSFVDLYNLLNQLEGFTVQTPSGSLHVNGRLLTIDSVSLAPNASEGASGSGASGSSKPKSGQLTGTITATAYVLPVGQSALGGATPSGPAGAGTTTSASSTASNRSTAGGPTAAVVKVNP
jgi:Type II secretion system (T2SS), protein M